MLRNLKNALTVSNILINAQYCLPTIYYSEKNNFKSKKKEMLWGGKEGQTSHEERLRPVEKYQPFPAKIRHVRKKSRPREMKSICGYKSGRIKS